ncbi:hypothetical protein BGP75_13145 [Motiliproteus sp. MSK22-1]|nr:hypothetical protein BGP75_13145 [Motiliproteus sp. MSK22-1]
MDRAKRQIRDAVNTGLDRHIRLAVTGLSQSGKTVFITALVDQLLQSHESRALPFFHACNDSRILAVKQLNADTDTPQFPYQQGLQALNNEPPGWPASTCDLSSVRLAIRYRPRSRLHRLVSESATLYLDIIDYPGEWLLDLPLLQLSYREWSQQQRELLGKEPRKSLAVKWLEAVSSFDSCGIADESRIKALSEQYRGLLSSFREQSQKLSLIQPGRFILPGSLEGSELLYFFPLVIGDETTTDKYPSGTNAELLERRYNAYRDQVVERFYQEHFSHFDRQVVLVDCLKTLNQGQACFDDMQLAITQILHSFNYGRAGFLRRLFSPRIDRVLFASTKADHITANQHHNLERFLELVVDEAKREILFEGIETRSMALSAFRSTETAEAMVDGQKLSCLKGFRKGNHEPVALFPGEVPTELPGEKDWSAERFNFIDFAPPRLAQIKGKAASHIRLDQALEFLVGDKFL